jgi:hypothetical protein
MFRAGYHWLFLGGFHGDFLKNIFLVTVNQQYFEGGLLCLVCGVNDYQIRQCVINCMFRVPWGTEINACALPT